MKTDPESNSTGGTRIRSVSRAARLLTLIASLPEDQRTVARFATQLNTSVPTIYHLINTLSDARLITRDEQKRFHLGVTVGALAVAYQNQTTPARELRERLRAIVDETGENAYLSAWRHGTPAVLLALAGTHAVQVANLRPGYHAAPHARASGKVLLAFTSDGERESFLAHNPLTALTPHTITDRVVLDKEILDVHANGFATDIEEFSLDVACIAVPITRLGMLLGAFTISAPLERYRDKHGEFLRVLKENAALVQDAGDIDG